MSFVHLHRHSEFSRLDGLGTAQQYAQRAAEMGQHALALTDHGTLSGALHHIVACSGKRKGKKIHEPLLPISGVEAYFRPNRLLAPKFKQREAWHLCLYAKNLKGWHNLLRIVSSAFQEPKDGGGFYQYPCVDWELLNQYSEGLACSSACVSSWISSLIAGGDSVAVNDYIDQMTAIFGDDFWIEIMPHDFDDQRTLNLELINIARDRSIPLIATNDAHFPLKEWAETQLIAKLCGHNSSYKKVEIEKEKGKAAYLGEISPNLYLCSEGEMREWFRLYHPWIASETVNEAINNTGEFVKKIVPFMLDKTDKLPQVVEGGLKPEDILAAWVEEGLDRIFQEYPETHWERWPKQMYRDRVNEEWAILKSKGVIDYFVLVGDVVRWCKSTDPLPGEKGNKEPIRVGLGRGSAAGCLISYLAGIVAVDPISWGLLFERFLNPSRKGLPDIDIDFQGDRRDEVKEYVARRHGREHVADIITHQRFQPKSVLQAVCRAADVPYLEAKAVTDTIEIRQDSEETTLEELLPLNKKLQEFKAKYPGLWEHCLRLEGTVQNASKHAAGVIITPKPIIEYMALERGKKGDLVTSWSDAADFPVVSDHGFVKLDALGIIGLTKHAYATRLIYKRHGKMIDLNKLGPLRDPYDVDDQVMEGFRNGWTIGVFQFGGAGITDLIKKISPSGSAFDLAAANALYRPGPMGGGVTWEYPKRKNAIVQHPPEWYWHDLVRPVLEETYGLIAYQEQVMEIGKQLGGMSGAQADDLRKAMGKLYRIKGGTEAKEFMAQYEEQWFKGCSDHEIPKKIADEIWHKILEFGHYGFNKSHSGSYALQAYQDMWLKIHYPLEFYAAFLTFEKDDDKKMMAIREAKQRGIKILPPDINKSGVGWSPDADALRMGLPAIKDVGDKAASTIISARSYGDFTDADDFRSRVPAKAVNSKAVTALIEAGAFDCWNAREHADEKTIAAWEKARLGMSLTVQGAAEKYADFLNDNIYTQDEVAQYAAGTSVIIGGEITKVEHKTTKKGDPFANITVVFEMNTWRVKFWKEALNKFNDLLYEGNCVMVTGKTDKWNDFISVVANQVTGDLEELQEA